MIFFNLIIKHQDKPSNGCSPTYQIGESASLFKGIGDDQVRLLLLLILLL
jgi:hypothetical protein